MKAREILDKSILSKVAKQFPRVIGKCLTTKSLGKAVPAAGIALGNAFNSATLKGVVDIANIAYWRWLLLEKYPQLGVTAEFEVVIDEESVAPDGVDETISVLDGLEEAGGPRT